MNKSIKPLVYLVFAASLISSKGFAEDVTETGSTIIQETSTDIVPVSEDESVLETTLAGLNETNEPTNFSAGTSNSETTEPVHLSSPEAVEPTDSTTMAPSGTFTIHGHTEPTTTGTTSAHTNPPSSGGASEITHGTSTIQITESTTSRPTITSPTTSVTPTVSNNPTTLSASANRTTVKSTNAAASSTEATTTWTTLDSGTTVEKRSTTTTMTTMGTTIGTTSVTHECVTSAPCVDPNSHCVNQGGRNTCECRLGFYRYSPGGRCVEITTSTASTPSWTDPSTTTTSSTSPTLTNNLDYKNKTDLVRQASELSKAEKMDVVSVTLSPAGSVVEWFFYQDSLFRSSIAKILNSTEFEVEEDPATWIQLNVSANQLVYVAPSPQVTTEGLLVSFLIKDVDGVAPRHFSSSGGIIARHRREDPAGRSSGFLPATWILSALHGSQSELEQALNQTVVALIGGKVPDELFAMEKFAAATLFDRRLDIFIPIILVAALCITGMIIGLICIKTKSKVTATWDPPAGVIFAKTSPRKEQREDPQGSVTKSDAMGQHLASDEQCRDGEEQLMRHSIQISNDDDTWVVPYEEAPQPGQSNSLKTQFEDTKL